MKKLYTAADLQEATLLHDLLLAHGISVKLLNTFAQGGMGELPFTHTYPEIWIEDEIQFNQAKTLIEEYEKKPGEIQMMTCVHCGEKCPENFELCWSCGQSSKN